MKLAAIELDGEQCVAVVEDGAFQVVAAGGQDLLLELAMSGEPPSIEQHNVAQSAARVLAPIATPPSIRDFYAFEAHVVNAQRGRGLEVDPLWYEHPSFYFTNPAAVVGPEVPIAAPVGCDRLDFELEVACVIGRPASDVDPLDPTGMGVIAGFTVLNDWSARDLQAHETPLKLGPTKGKDFATSLGPWLVTPDEFIGVDVGRPRSSLRAFVNDHQICDAELADIHFSWTEILARASANTRLVPGDVIGSGTCGWGCLLEWQLNGHGDQYPWLQPGDRVTLEVERIGRLSNPIVSR